MTEIYQKAEVIYAWLGVPFDEEETRMAVKILREFNQFLYEGLERHGGDLSPVAASMTTDSVGFPTGSKPGSISALDGIADMFNRHYWQRTWIYKEATIPGEYGCVLRGAVGSVKDCAHASWSCRDQSSQSFHSIVIRKARSRELVDISFSIWLRNAPRPGMCSA